MSTLMTSTQKKVQTKVTILLHMATVSALYEQHEVSTLYVIIMRINVKSNNLLHSYFTTGKFFIIAGHKPENKQCPPPLPESYQCIL